jgi:L-iditol 2-dehydrogenase
MKALVYEAFETHTLKEIPVPTPAEGEVLLRVAACGICGSELESFKNKSPRRPPPLVMGHEFCGWIEDPNGSNSWQKGQAVICNALVPCDKCTRCKRGDTHLCADRQVFGMHRQGAFTQFVAAPVQALIPWPEDLEAKAACLAEPIGNGVHMTKLTQHLNAENVLIIGAGPIGLAALLAFKSLRNSKIIIAEISNHRRETGLGLGAESGVDPSATDTVDYVMEQTGGEGVDLVIDSVGAGITNKQAIAALRPGGAAVFIGLHENKATVNSYDLILPEKQIIGTYAATLSDLSEAVRLMSETDIDVTSWTQTYSIDQAEEAFETMLRPSDSDIKGIILPNN